MQSVALAVAGSIVPAPWATWCVQGLVGLALAGCVVGFMAWVRAWWRDEGARALRVPVAVTLVALALRLAVPAGPYDVNLRTTDILWGIDPGGWRYGVAYPTMWRLLLPWADRTLAHVFTGNAVVGALSCGVLVLVLREAGAASRVAGLAGLLLALDPVHARFSHTDVQAILEVLLFCVGVGAWLRWCRLGQVGWAVLAGAALGLASTCRPEGVLLPLFALLPAFAVGQGMPRRAGSVAAAGVCVALLGSHLAGMLVFNDTSGGLSRIGLGGSIGPVVHGLRHWLALDPAWTSWPLVVAAVVGVAGAPGAGWRRAAWLGMALGLGAFLLDATWSPASEGTRMLARHQLRALPWFAVLVASASAVWPARQAIGLAVTGVLVVAATIHAGEAFRPATSQLEFHAAIEALAEVEDGCTVVTWLPEDDRGMAVQRSFSRLAGRRHTWVGLDGPLPPRGCVVWYRPANCDTVSRVSGEVDGACAMFEASHTLTERRVTTLPAEAWGLARYATPTVRVGTFDVVRR